jgi:hypothetical protein
MKQNRDGWGCGSKPPRDSTTQVNDVVDDHAMSVDVGTVTIDRRDQRRQREQRRRTAQEGLCSLIAFLTANPSDGPQ